ncbi:MAG: hypothetical protein GEU86_09935 [Actinophytocola sp.]|nr:hypothetical protein [Actinophytocola sp.]
MTSLETDLVWRLAAAYAAEPADDVALAAALEDALRLARATTVDELPPVAELAGELADVYERLGRVDDAVAAMREAISAGWKGVPDGRCRIAEILTGAGRLAEATAIWQEVAAEYPDDVWVHNNAGVEYAAAGEHDTALDYLTRGLRLALDTGDPERLVDQLADFRGRALTALGQEPDALQARAADFRAAAPATRPMAPAVISSPAEPEPSGAPVQEPIAMAFAWFSRDDYPRAVARWPELVDTWGVTDYPGYCAALEGHLATFAATAGRSPRIAPIELPEYEAWCADSDRDPADSGSRASYAAELARTGRAMPWPPARNAPCWCGSGRKYKRCCRAAALSW